MGVKARQLGASSASDSRPTVAKIQNGGSDTNRGSKVGSHSQMTLFMATEPCTLKANDSSSSPCGLITLAASMPAAATA